MSLSHFGFLPLFCGSKTLRSYIRKIKLEFCICGNYSYLMYSLFPCKIVDSKKLFSLGILKALFFTLQACIFADDFFFASWLTWSFFYSSPRQSVYLLVSYYFQFLIKYSKLSSRYYMIIIDSICYNASIIHYLKNVRTTYPLIIFSVYQEVIIPLFMSATSL